ncbi:MAG: hemoglobin [Sphingobacteriales bacterium]|nr:MAG: hemoglobin [Sphingobacteriales bacterium]
MGLTLEQIQLVKSSWGPFRRIDPKLVGDVFYSKLFMENPQLRRLFPKNMDEQYQKLLAMVNLIVGRLNQIEKLTDDISAMARRHVSYGVKAEHYTAVGNALLWTLEQGMGKDWRPEVQQAWAACYSILSDTMINASYPKVQNR